MAWKERADNKKAWICGDPSSFAKSKERPGEDIDAQRSSAWNQSKSQRVKMVQKASESGRIYPRSAHSLRCLSQNSGSQGERLFFRRALRRVGKGFRLANFLGPELHSSRCVQTR
jgi:hypothetical protein